MHEPAGLYSNHTKINNVAQCMCKEKKERLILYIVPYNKTTVFFEQQKGLKREAIGKIYRAGERNI